MTNVTVDHFGEYGIHDLDGLAQAKLAIAHLIGAEGLVILNADDPLLRAKGAALAVTPPRKPIGWFALELNRARTAGGVAASGVRKGQLVLEWRGVEHLLGAIESFPLTLGGSAVYNIANLAAAAVVAAAVGVAPVNIAAAFSRFGERAADNPGRLQRYVLGGITLLLDYAHNADGLAGLLHVAETLRGHGFVRGRLLLLLGHAGNRQLSDFDALAAVAAAAHPDLIVLKEIEGFERGRQRGEIPLLLQAALVRHGMSRSALTVEAGELDAVRCALARAHTGDVLVMPVHALRARAATLALIETLLARGWRAGQPLP